MTEDLGRERHSPRRGTRGERGRERETNCHCTNTSSIKRALMMLCSLFIYKLFTGICTRFFRHSRCLCLCHILPGATVSLYTAPGTTCCISPYCQSQTLRPFLYFFIIEASYIRFVSIVKQLLFYACWVPNFPLKWMGNCPTNNA